MEMFILWRPNKLQSCHLYELPLSISHPIAVWLNDYHEIPVELHSRHFILCATAKFEYEYFDIIYFDVFSFIHFEILEICVVVKAEETFGGVVRRFWKIPTRGVVERGYFNPNAKNPNDTKRWCSEWSLESKNPNATLLELGFGWI